MLRGGRLSPSPHPRTPSSPQTISVPSSPEPSLALTDLPPRDHRHLRQEEHAPGGLLHPRAQVGVPGPKLFAWVMFALTSPLVTSRPGLGEQPRPLKHRGEKQGTAWSRRVSHWSFSLFLFKLGLAPQIQDLYGKVDFTGRAPCGGARAGGWRPGFATNARRSLGGKDVGNEDLG